MITNVAQSINLEQFSRTERQLCGAVFGSRNARFWPQAARHATDRNYVQRLPELAAT
jgi:hypothetical protein